LAIPTITEEYNNEHPEHRRLRPGHHRAERYRPDPAKVLKGDPEQAVYNHYNSPCGQLNAGVWEGAVGQWTVNYTEHEYCEIVQGVSVLRDTMAMPRPCAPVIASSSRPASGHLGSAGALPQDLCDV
jgi:uncharacterized cupin superfamily protein